MTGRTRVAEETPSPVAEIDDRSGFFVSAPTRPVTRTDESPRAVDAARGGVLDVSVALGKSVMSFADRNDEGVDEAWADADPNRRAELS
jgi:hypothetical protein